MKNRFLAKEHVYVFLITILSSGFDGGGRPILSFRNRDFRSTFSLPLESLLCVLVGGCGVRMNYEANSNVLGCLFLWFCCFSAPACFLCCFHVRRGV